MSPNASSKRSAARGDALCTRLGLKSSTSTRKPFRVKPHDFGFAPGLDLDKMNQLVDDLEAAAAAQKAKE